MRAPSDHRARIEAALPPGKVMTPEAWGRLDEIIEGYRVFENQRTTYPIIEERKRWQRLGKAVDEAAAELRQLPRSGPDSTWPDRALAALLEVQGKVENQAAFHEIWTAFSRRQNPHRDFLFWAVMRVWTDHLDGALRYSKAKDGTIFGPLVRFILACVGPVLGAGMPHAGIADIIDRERSARESVEAGKRRMGF